MSPPAIIASATLAAVLGQAPPGQQVEEGTTDPGDAPPPATEADDAPERDDAGPRDVSPREREDGGLEPATPELDGPQEPPEGLRRLTDALVLDAGASCLDADSLLGHMVAWRDSEFVDERVEIVVQGTDANPREVAFMIRWDGELKAKRRFAKAPARCPDMHAVVGLALAIGLDDTLAESIGIVPPPLPEPVAIDDAEAIDLPPGHEEREPPPPPEPWKITVSPSVMGSMGLGVTPGLSGGGTLGLDLGLGKRFDLRIAAWGLFANNRPVGDGTVDVTVLAGNVDLCAAMRPRRVRPRLCLGAAAGSVASEGNGYTTSNSSTLPWVGVDLGTDLRIGLSKALGLLIGLRAVVPVVRNELGVRNSEDPDSVLDRLLFPPVGGIVSLGFTVDLQ